MSELPPTRWELGAESYGGAGNYAQRFADLLAEGKDVEGEARLADVLVGRGARILDAGSGMGRIGAALQARGHQVIAVEKDPELVAESRRLYPDLRVIESDLLAFTPQTVDAGFDLVVLVGNVIVLLAPDTERRVLAGLAALLAEGGRILVGFHPVAFHGSARNYPIADFTADAAAAGLQVQHRFGTYELGEPSDDYCVAILSRSGSSAGH